MLDYNNPDPEVRLLIASADNTPAEVLQKLSEDSDSEVRKSAASNPNTPIEILEKLGEEFPEAITDDPVFNILLLENPDGEFVQLSLARSSATFEDILWEIATNTNNTSIHVFKVLEKYLLKLVAEYPNTFLLILEKLVRIEDIYPLIGVNTILIEVAGNYTTSIQILEKLASHRNVYVRQDVAENPNTQPQVLEKLADDENESVWRLAKQNLATNLKVDTE